MIEVNNIHKGFSGNKVLKGITTSFEQGKTNLIIGTSGSGKTVFLKCLLGLFKPCLLYTSPSPRDKRQSRMPSSA